MNNACNKARFSTWAEANERLKEIRSRHLVKTKYRIPNRVYQCPKCNGFHLTSKEERHEEITIENPHPGWAKLL